MCDFSARTLPFIFCNGFFALILLSATISCQNTSKDASVNLDSLLISGIRKTNALNFEDAYSELSHLIELAHARNDHRNEVLGNINMGALYLRYNGQDEAIRYFLQAEELAETNNVDDLLNTVYNNIGIIYSTNDSREKAIEYYEKALAISRKQNNEHRIAINLINLSTEVKRKGDSQLAVKYLNQALPIFLVSEDTLNASVSHNNMGDLYYEKLLYDSALLHFRKALQLSTAIHDNYYKPQYCLSLGRTFFKLQQYDSSEIYLQKSLNGFQKTKSSEGIIADYEWLSDVSKKENNIAQALEYSSQMLAWKDSLLKEKTSTWISELQMKYEFGKKEKEVELLQTKARQQTQFWIGIVLVGITIALLIFFILRAKNTNLEQRNIILQKEQQLNHLTLEKNRVEREQLEKDIVANERLNELEKQKLKQELLFKDRELAAKALHLVNKNEVLSSIHEVLESLDLQDNASNKEQVRKAKKIIRSNENMDEEWEAFKRHFEEVHPSFFSRLIEHFPDLSPNDLRLSAYLLIDLNAKEIAHIFNISPESVRKKKQRLREKLNLEKEEDIKVLLSRYRQFPT